MKKVSDGMRSKIKVGKCGVTIHRGEFDIRSQTDGIEF